MAGESKNIIYTAKDFERYHSGAMNEAEMHALEKAALEDTFLSDALDGYVHTATAEKDIAELKDRLAKNKKIKAVVTMEPRKNNLWWKIAAIFILVAGTFYFSLKFNSTKDQPALAKNEPGYHGDKYKSTDTVLLNNDKPKENVAFEQGEKKTAELKLPEPGKLPLNTGHGKSDMPTTNQDYYFTPSSPIETEKSIGNIADDKDRAEILEDRSVVAAKPVSRQDDAKFRFKGKVVDEEGNPVPFVSIKNKNANTLATSDTSGKFSIVNNDSIMSATIAAVGYSSIQKELKNGIDQTIVLSPASTVLSEAVVTGYGTARKKSATAATKKISEKDIETGIANVSEPVNGMAAFRQYLADSIRIIKTLNNQPYKGVVLLSFKVNKNGTPQKIKVEKPLCETCDEEAARLLINGPKWKFVNSRRVTVTVNF